MRVRFVLPNDDGGPPLFDRYIENAHVPLPGETVGITPDQETGRPEHQWLVWCENRRWYVGEVGDGEPVVEVWLTKDYEVGHSLADQGRCRVAFERRMAQSALMTQ